MKRDPFWGEPDCSDSECTSDTESVPLSFVLAKYSILSQRHCGYQISICWDEQTACISKYEGFESARVSYSSWSSYRLSRQSSMAAISETCTRMAFIPFATMMHNAENLVDPDMQLRNLHPQDCHYEAVTCLYVSFRWYMLVCRWRDDWLLREWSHKAVCGVVRLQAAFRSWRFRKNVMYNPNNPIGRMYITRNILDLPASVEHIRNV